MDALADPSAARDRSVLLPWMEPGSFAVINRDWRYIRYSEGGEELYNVQDDPNEWFNLAGNPEYADTLASLNAQGPKHFAPPGEKLNARRHLILEGETFRWQKSD